MDNCNTRPYYGQVIEIAEDGTDRSPPFKLATRECYYFGRGEDCDIQINLEAVSIRHCALQVEDNLQVSLINLCSLKPTKINAEDVNFGYPNRLSQCDQFTISRQSFRFEYQSDLSPSKDNQQKDPHATKKKKTKEQVKARNKRRRKAKKERYWIERRKLLDYQQQSYEYQSVQLVEEMPNKSKKGKEGKILENSFFKEIMKDSLFSGMVHYQKTKRYSMYTTMYLDRKNGKLC